MSTKREALAEQGLAIAGARGKFSKAANAWLDEQRAKGVKFSDDNGPVIPKATGDPVEKVAVYNPGNSEYVTPSDYRFPEGEYRATVFSDGKKEEITLRWCCDNCHVSLVNHGCNDAVWHGKVVTIERR